MRVNYSEYIFFRKYIDAEGYHVIISEHEDTKTHPSCRSQLHRYFGL